MHIRLGKRAHRKCTLSIVGGFPTDFLLISYWGPIIMIGLDKGTPNEEALLGHEYNEETVAYT